MGMLRQLTYDECMRRLEAGSIGRVAITEHALPAILPVNYVRSGTHILFRTEPGGTLARGCNGSVVAFEIDGVGCEGAAGWSVLVIGTATLLDGDGVDVADGVALTSAVSAGRDQFVAVSLGQVSGREVVAEPRIA